MTDLPVTTKAEREKFAALQPSVEDSIREAKQPQWVERRLWILREEIRALNERLCALLPAFREVKEPRSDADVNHIWETFWRPLVTDADGNLDPDAVKRELSDFYSLMGGAAEVYEHATGGLISKPMTYPSSVRAVIDDHVQQAVDDALKEQRAELRRQIAALKEERYDLECELGDEGR